MGKHIHMRHPGRTDFTGKAHKFPIKTKQCKWCSVKYKTIVNDPNRPCPRKKIHIEKTFSKEDRKFQGPEYVAALAMRNVGTLIGTKQRIMFRYHKIMEREQHKFSFNAGELDLINRIVHNVDGYPLPRDPAGWMDWLINKGRLKKNRGKDDLDADWVTLKFKLASFDYLQACALMDLLERNLSHRHDRSVQDDPYEGSVEVKLKGKKYLNPEKMGYGAAHASFLDNVKMKFAKEKISQFKSLRMRNKELEQAHKTIADLEAQLAHTQNLDPQIPPAGDTDLGETETDRSE